MKIFFIHEDMPRKALLAVRNPHTCEIADMVRTCQNVGTTAYNTNSQAAALAAHFQVLDMLVGGCFKCSSMGHFKKDCPQQRDRIKIPPRDCSQCRRNN